MAPKEKVSSHILPTGILNENDAETIDGALLKPEGRIAKIRSFNLVWRNIILMSILHLMALYGGWLLFSGKTKWQTVLFGKLMIQFRHRKISSMCSTAYSLYIASGLGITAGVHRLWSHRAYKARWPLRLMLMLFNTIAFQGTFNCLRSFPSFIFKR